MAVVFLLGPGVWDSARRQPSDPAPLQVRRDLAAIFTRDHRVILMKDDPDREGEDLIQKFDRLLRNKVSDVVLYWPPADRRDFLRRQKIRLWALHHSSVATITGAELKVLETGSRSRYLTAVARLGLRPLEWDTEEDLRKQARLLSAGL